MRYLLTTILTLVLISSSFAGDVPIPTTTLADETGNNTSAATAFLSQADGNMGAGNISKVPTRTLLYPGSTTQIFAHVEPWWGSSKHPDVGYSSQDPSQVQRQVEDMISRGLNGAVPDWYGPDSYEALGAKMLLTEAEHHPDFHVFVEVEHGAVQWDSCFPGCSATTAVIQLFTRVANDFFSSPAYFRIGGRPVVREFAMETLGQSVDWNAVQAQVPGNPLIIHRNLGGFGIAQSGGAYGWMEPKTLDSEPANYDGTDELNWFYSNAVATYPSTPTFGAVWKGFNDILASWAPPGGRHIEQNCGKTWLNTFAAANQYYSASRQLPILQLITWNDYEEGSEMETGIDNCVSVSASVSGTQLKWSISGDPSTLDHFTVFISTDDKNLASIGEFPVGTSAFDLSQFEFPAGKYSLYVKAVGKPSLRNHMSSAAAMTIAASTASTGGKDVTITATPASAQVSRGQSTQVSLALTQKGATDPVSLSCSNLPDGATCSFSPSSLTPGAQPSNVAMTISTAQMSALSRINRSNAPLFAFWAPGAFGIVMLPSAMGIKRARRKLRSAGLAVVALLLLTLFACGGGATKSRSEQSSTSSSSVTATSSTSVGSYTVVVTAKSGSVTRSTTVNLTVH